MEHEQDNNETYEIDGPPDRGRGFFDPAKIAAASAAVAAAIHGEDDGSVEELVRASLEADLDRIAKLNVVRKKYGQPIFDDGRIGAIVHDCLPGSERPWNNPRASDRKAVNGEWRCTQDFHGCFSCYWVEYKLKAK